MHHLKKIIGIGAFWVFATIAPVYAQVADAGSYPSRPIKLIVPFVAGGTTDFTARVYAEEMSKDLGQPIVIENRPGADSAIGAQQVARTEADGYTLLFAMDVTMVMNPLTKKDLPYKPLEDFQPISLASLNTSVLVVPASGPKTVQELVAQAKANPGKLNFGAGIITTRLAGEFFNKLTGIEAVFVPYKGSVEVLTGLLNGSIQYAVDGVSTYVSLVEENKVRALAKLNKRPLASLPDLKPLDELAGLPQLGEISTWTAFVGPSGLSPAIVDRIQRAVEKTANRDDIRARLSKVGIVAASSTPDELKGFVVSELKKWEPVVKESGLQLAD